ncbi:uncharacterized protein LODBEIA_P52200 [Lodderomyces beijingensis]|uniref:Ubiquitin-like domain-containing protein n=1 Tax=Lodderomyces beijingensis TaxID=1775926 RepID=A0ABP0ZVA5_9ASCO
MTPLLDLLHRFDDYVTAQLASNAFTANLLTTPTSKLITEALIIVFILLSSYEVVYWSGIYLRLWEYHAKDIFPEVPVHCAHINIRLNVISADKVSKLSEYCELKRKFYSNIIYWKQLNSISDDLFALDQFVRFYFEFSPEDFEMNKEPEYGSTISHLRLKVLKLFNSAESFASFERGHVARDDVKIFNNKNEEVPVSLNEEYLSKCNIETGNVIDVVVVV